MKQFVKNTILAAAVTFLASACLNLEPKDQMPDSYVWSSAENFALFANQFYGWTRDFQGSTSVNSMNGVSDGPHSDFRSDLLVGTGENVYNKGTNVIPTSDPNYSNLYKRLYYTNLLLKNAEGFGNPSAIRQPVGEACFFRAYLYFELVQLYGDVILVEEPVDLDNEKLYGARDNRLDVINLCISDLKKAVELLPETPSESGRLCKYAAAALLSRIALYEGTWQKYHFNRTDAAQTLLKDAADYARMVMDSKKYELFFNEELGGKDSYRYMFILETDKCNPAGLTKADNKEYILAKRHDEALKPIGYNITHATASAMFPTKKLADLYRCQDGLPISESPLFQGYSGMTTEFINRDNRMDASLLRHGERYWDNDGKWRTSWDAEDEQDGRCKIADVRHDTGYSCHKWATERKVMDAYEAYDYPVIRYAEVLLNYAEAVFELNGGITDTELDASLNLVRRRSNPQMTKLSNGLVSTNNLDMLTEIRAERTVELFHEGFRIDDLKRWKTAETEMPGNRLGILYGGQFATAWPGQANPLDANGNIIKYDGCTWQQRNYLYPIPSDELQLNPQLGQNDGWK